MKLHARKSTLKRCRGAPHKQAGKERRWCTKKTRSMRKKKATKRSMCAGGGGAFAFKKNKSIEQSKATAIENVPKGPGRFCPEQEGACTAERMFSAQVLVRQRKSG